MHRELQLSVVLEPDQAHRRGIVPVVVGADHHDVEVAVAVDVGGLWTRSTGQVREAMKLELHLPLVLEPLYAVPWPAVRWCIVERVTIAEENIQVVVAIQVDNRHPARSEVRVTRSPHHL